MPYLPETTIVEVLRQIQSGELVLPAIQREYVWKPAQVTALFDSVMRGYPIGSFLSWRVEPSTAERFRFYGFMREYNELNQRHNPQLDIAPTSAVTAVLDGQQRLTSLNVGLRGSYAWKKKYGWSHLPENYPARTLHLNLAHKAEENAAGLEYDFRFLEPAQLAALSPQEARYWIPVPLVYEAREMQDLMMELAGRQIANDREALGMATALWTRVHAKPAVQFFQETDQDIERVLDIFIRVNSGGTVLSYSDLLLSIATAQWQEKDARKEIHNLVDNLNNTGAGFRFSHDLVLKTGLVLAGVPDIAFKVKNFTSANMQLLSDSWDDIAQSLRVATELLSDFGLSAQSVTANSVLIPLAMYVHHRKLTQTYRELPSESQDRAAVREWTLRSLIVPGIWGSGLDQLLRALRETIVAHGGQHFPAAELERTMAARGKSLRVSEEIVDALLDLRYGDATTFPVLAMLFPHVNTRNNHHVDHVVPTAGLTKSALRRAGHSEDEVESILLAKDRLPNLELLEGLDNISKSAKMPADWAQEVFPTPDDLAVYRERQAMPAHLPADLNDFSEFYTQRRTMLRERLLRTLGATQPAATEEQATVPPIDEAVEAEQLS